MQHHAPAVAGRPLHTTTPRRAAHHLPRSAARRGGAAAAGPWVRAVQASLSVGVRAPRAPAELGDGAAPLARGRRQLAAAPARERIAVPEEAGHAACHPRTHPRRASLGGAAGARSLSSTAAGAAGAADWHAGRAGTHVHASVLCMRQATVKHIRTSPVTRLRTTYRRGSNRRAAVPAMAVTAEIAAACACLYK